MYQRSTTFDPPDIRKASAIILEACLTSRYVYLDRDAPVLAKQVIVGDVVAIELKARPYVLDTKYEKPFETDVHTRVAEAFREHGILPPAVLVRTVPDRGAPASPPGRLAGPPAAVV